MIFSLFSPPLFLWLCRFPSSPLLWRIISFPPPSLPPLLLLVQVIISCPPVSLPPGSSSPPLFSFSVITVTCATAIGGGIRGGVRWWGNIRGGVRPLPAPPSLYGLTSEQWRAWAWEDWRGAVVIPATGWPGRALIGRTPPFNGVVTTKAGVMRRVRDGREVEHRFVHFYDVPLV